MYDRKEMFRAVCSDCGDNCEVPFKPTGSKPVLCSSCFGKQGGGGRSSGRDSRSGGRDRGGRFGGRDSRSGGRDRGDREMHSVVCDDCGDNCQVPFRPTAGKPIYCDSCFGKHNDRGDRRGGGRDSRGGGSGGDRRGGSGGDNDKMARELSSMNSKLDRLITLLDPSAKSEKKAVPKKVKEDVVAPLDLDLDVKPKAFAKGGPVSGGKAKTVKKLVAKKATKTKVTNKVTKKSTKKVAKKKK